jgi:transcriptional regulator with XRE-family HTH domain
MEAQQILAWNMRKIRVTRGISQEKLALEAGVERAYYGKLERGSENVTIGIIASIAKALDVPIADLFRMPLPGEEPPKALQAGRKKA